jgi:hypothetical protein
MKLLLGIGVAIGGWLLLLAHGFVVPSTSSCKESIRYTAMSPLQMGIFDSLQKAFSNEEVCGNKSV